MLEENSSTRPRGRLAHELETQEAGTLGSRDRSRSRPHLRAARFEGRGGAPVVDAHLSARQIEHARGRAERG